MLNNVVKEQRCSATRREWNMDFPKYRSLLTNVIMYSFINNECILTKCKLIFCREDNLFTTFRAYTLKNGFPEIALEDMQAVLNNTGFYPEERTNGIIVYPGITYDKAWAKQILFQEGIQPEFGIELALYKNDLSYN